MISFDVVSTGTAQVDNPFRLDVTAQFPEAFTLMGVRTSFTPGTNAGRNFNIEPRFYQVGQVVAYWDGYVTYQGFLEYSNQFHFRGFNDDTRPEVMFAYPDSFSLNTPEEDQGASKINGGNAANGYQYIVSSSNVAKVGRPFGGDSDISYARDVIKTKSRLFQEAIPFDEILVEVINAGTIVLVEVIAIR